MKKAEKQTSKPDTETIRLTYDQLEVALISLSLRQEELRESRLQVNNVELGILWDISDKMDEAQRRLESKMTQQVTEWLRAESPKQIRTKKSTRVVKEPIAPTRNILSSLSRLFRL